MTKDSITDHLKAIVTVLSLANPAICDAMFARIEADWPRGEQLADSVKATVTILAIQPTTRRGCRCPSF